MELAENSVDAPPSRVVGRPFAPGVSGNPGGRPRGLARYVRELVGDGSRTLLWARCGVRRLASPCRGRLVSWANRPFELRTREAELAAHAA